MYFNRRVFLHKYSNNADSAPYSLAHRADLLYVLRRKTHVSTPGLQVWNALPYLIHALCSPFFFQRQSQNLPFLTFLASQVSVEIQSQTTAGLSFVIKTCSFSSSILPLSPTLC